MATGFGFCSNCGASIGAAGQRFCPTCGTVIPAASAAVPAPAAAPTQPPAWGAPPPPPPPADGQPQVWGTPPAAPLAAPARSGISPVMLLVGGVVIVAIVAGAIFAMNNSKGSPGASGATGSTIPGGGSVVFNPSTIGCPSQPYTTTIVLPSSVKGTDSITYKIDSTIVITQTVAEFGFAQKPDGTWSVSDTNSTGSTHCDMGAGVHTARLVDANGKVLAQGAFTFVMSASPSAAKPSVAEPTPSPTPEPPAQGTVTIKPSKMSCSAASVSVSLSVVLPGTIPDSAMISSELDGAIQNTSTAADGFVKQADGTWLSTGTTDSSTLCSELAIGDHTIRALDASSNVLAEGTFTLQP
jgi:hypothetical protein